MKTLSETTLIPISFLLVLLIGSVWVSDVKSSTDNNKQDIARLEKEQKDINNILRSIDQRLSRIEGHLGVDKNKGE